MFTHIQWGRSLIGGSVLISSFCVGSHPLPQARIAISCSWDNANQGTNLGLGKKNAQSIVWFIVRPHKLHAGMKGGQGLNQGHPFHQQHRSPLVQKDQQSLARWPDPNPAKATVSPPHYLLLEGFQRWVSRERVTHSSTMDTLAKTSGNHPLQFAKVSHSTEL